MIEPEIGQVDQCGSTKGVEFLKQNEAIWLKFMGFVGKT
jgi:hypothetical protein